MLNRTPQGLQQSGQCTFPFKYLYPLRKAINIMTPSLSRNQLADSFSMHDDNIDGDDEEKSHSQLIKVLLII